MTITAIRYRAEGAVVVLQVLEEEEPRDIYPGRIRSYEWRDARVEDLLEVARYTRAYDALDSIITSMQSTVINAQEQMSAINTRSMQEQLARMGNA